MLTFASVRACVKVLVLYTSVVCVAMAGRVIRGWDYGLPTMKRGEVATLYIKPEYAYGDAGFYDVIGPRETLAIEVQLYDWRSEICSWSSEIQKYLPNTLESIDLV